MESGALEPTEMTRDASLLKGPEALLAPWRGEEKGGEGPEGTGARGDPLGIPCNNSSSPDCRDQLPSRKWLL